MIIFADSFSSLWKQYEQAQRNDLPQTSVNILNKIISKAKNKKEYGHLLKATLLHAQIATQIAPDSLFAEMEHIKRSLKLTEKKNTVLAAVYQSVLGRMYKEFEQLGNDRKALSQQYYRESLSHPEQLAAHPSTEYEPFVIQGIDSKIFHNDLLHVLAMEAQDYKTMHQYYKNCKNRPATCISAMLLARHKYNEDYKHVQRRKYIQVLDSLIDIYKDLPQASELAIERYNCMEEIADISAEQKIQYIDYALSLWGAMPRINILRNAKSQLTLPTFHISLGNSVQIPNHETKVAIMQLCNIQQLNLSVWRLNIQGNTTLNPNTKPDYERLRNAMLSSTPIYTTQKRFVGIPNYQVVRDTMTIKGLPIGVYLTEISTNNKNMKPQRALLNISDLYVLSHPLPEKQLRLVVVSATTGQPVPNAQIQITSNEWSETPQVPQILKCNKQGEAILKNADSYQYNIYPYTKADKACAETTINSYGSFPKTEKQDDLYVDLFTDRSIYRPGQMVHASAVVYHVINNERANIAAHQKVTLILKNANYEEVGRQSAETDDYGTAAVNFTLPQHHLTGTFTLRSSVGRNGYKAFTVEEYKRPTFYTEFAPVNDKYQTGDIVKVKGTAKNFAGIPIQGAKIKYTITRSRTNWWWNHILQKQDTLAAKETTTNAQGEFIIPVHMLMPKNDKKEHNAIFSFNIKADITDGTGESHIAETYLPLSEKAAMLTCNLPKQNLTDSIKPMTFGYTNNRGNNIDTEVKYTIDGKAFTTKTNQPTLLGLKDLASGEHQLIAICREDTLKTKFVVFSLNDKKPAAKTSDFFYLTSETFHLNNKPVYMLLGSSDYNVHVVYTLIAGNKQIESGTLPVNNEIIKRSFTYQPDYANGLLLNYAWVKNGKLYTHSIMLAKPKPDTHLLVTWKTFRNKLLPGQKEEWTLKICKPNGTAAKAQLMAVLFDKTLEQLKPHHWNFNIPYHPAWASAIWSGLNLDDVILYGDASFTTLSEPQLAFSHYIDVFESEYGNLYPMLLTSTASMNMYKANNANISRSMTSKHNGDIIKKVQPEDAPQQQIERKPKEVNKNLSVRNNFNETAFFYPALLTDKKGEIAIKFTLPQSITSWQFMALAHDKQMCNGMLKDEVIAQKTVMIQPNMPRFVRSSDCTTLSSRIANISQNKVQGTALLELINPETEKVIATWKEKYSLQPASTYVVAFNIDVPQLLRHHPQLSLLTVKVTAYGKGYSDGEQHYLPILPDKEWITNTLPLTLHHAGTKKINLSKLFSANNVTNRLSIEYTENPAWLMVQALPSMTTSHDNDAISLTAAHYANSIAQHLLQQVPQLRTIFTQWKNEKCTETSLMSNLEKNKELKNILLSETPWMTEAKTEAEQKQKLSNFFNDDALNYHSIEIIDKLKSLQQKDGSFSWWEGMKGNRNITTSVAMMLTRLYTLIGEEHSTLPMLRQAIHYLDNETIQEVRKIKKAEKERNKDVMPSENALAYLYIRALNGEAFNNNTKYLLNWVCKHSSAFTIYGKALVAVALNLYGYQTEAKSFLQSIHQYSVYSEEMGRYFDTPKAYYSWFSYKIPTQVAVIEATQLLAPHHPYIEEMQRWLLQSKRTQCWDTPINNVDAIYAFLRKHIKQLSTTILPATISVNHQAIKLPKASAALGYFKVIKEGKDFKQLTINKTSNQTSWGAVYAQFQQQSNKASNLSAGLKVTRTLLYNGKPAKKLKVGDRITVRIEIEAQRNYDFVQLQDKRTACMEPVQQLSGYRNNYYCAPEDEVTNYYFDKLSKGKHVIETEYFIDRAGSYYTGICTVQCAYSPEYRGCEAAKEMKIRL